MDDQVVLYDSIICRLCAESSCNGCLLFASQENETDLATTINRYLPLKVQNDGKYPRTICPGCNIQLDAMVQFIELVISGQEKIRQLWRRQQEMQKRKEKENLLLEQRLFNSDSNIGPFTLQTIEESGNEILIQIMPDGSFYPADHEMSLRVEGLEKPKRKRGRPPKPPPGTVQVKEDPKPEPGEEEIVVDEADGGKKKRRRKVPTRYREAVQGKELERIFREEGVIDEEEETEEAEMSDEKSVTLPGTTGDEIIGHLENKDGQDLGELVVVNKVKNRVRQVRRRKKFICEVCDRGFMHYGRYLVHKNFHKGVRYECTTCAELYNTKENLKDHQTLTGHSGEGIVESLDNEITEQNEEEKEPILKVEPSPEHKFPCDQCEKSFMSKQSYEVHFKAIHEGMKPFQCDKCDKSFAYHASLKGHMSSHEQKSEKGYPCDMCEKIFNHPSSVVYHKEAEHNNGRRFVCNKCGKSFKHKQLLQRHQLVHTEDRPYVCKACGATFKTRANLLNHQPTHTGVKKYFCQQCGQLFAHKTSLTLHYRWHSGQKPYECPICKKAFSQKGNLQEHKRIHTGEKPFSCDYCARKFTTSSQFKLHVKRHTGERPWSCEYCAKTFLHKDTWKCHMRRHRNERPYQCPSCFRDFTEQWALKKHLRLHTGEKPYVCEVCHKAFADCSNLTKHKRIHRSLDSNNVDHAQGSSSDLFLVAYPDSNGMPELVTIMNDPSNDELRNANSQLDPVGDESLLPTTQQTQLALENFSNNALGGGTLQVTDVDGNPLIITQDGGQLHVIALNGENLQVALDDGTTIPLQLDVDKGQSPNQQMDDKMKFDDRLITSNLIEENKNDAEDNEVNNLMNQPVEFMTEDGQSVCFVPAYNIDSDNVNSEYLPIT